MFLQKFDAKNLLALLSLGRASCITAEMLPRDGMDHKRDTVLELNNEATELFKQTNQVWQIVVWTTVGTAAVLNYSNEDTDQDIALEELIESDTFLVAALLPRSSFHQLSLEPGFSELLETVGN